MCVYACFLLVHNMYFFNNVSPCGFTYLSERDFLKFSCSRAVTMTLWGSLIIDQVTCLGFLFFFCQITD